MKPLLQDHWPCPAESAEDVEITLTRCPWIGEWEYREGRIFWSLLTDDPPGDAACKHLKIKQHIQRAISLHHPLDWQP